MRNLTVTICLAVALQLGSAGVSWSQDFQKGLTAAQSADFATALREWTPLAKQGDASAQHNLGVMYYIAKELDTAMVRAFTISSIWTCS